MAADLSYSGDDWITRFIIQLTVLAAYGYDLREMGRPHAATTKYPRRKPKPGKFVFHKRSSKATSVRALQHVLTGTPHNLTEFVHKPPSAEAIRALRQHLGLSQASFAAQLGVFGAITIYQWESGRRCPQAKWTARLHELAEMNGLDLGLMTDPDYYRNFVKVRLVVDKEIKSA